VSDPKVSFPFYKEMLGLLGYKVLMEDTSYVGMQSSSEDFAIWLNDTPKEFLDKKFHRKAPGLNHLAFKVGSKADVDTFYQEFLQKRNIKPLYESPKPFPEYTPDYYAVFFEDPDRVKIEVVSL
jgi:catechol 2,3-dioxygenase-like lactoylglutathione lyase family enzyme